MTRQRYSINEALNRLLRILKDKAVPSEEPGAVDGEILSDNQSISDLAELFAGSLPNETLTFPTAIYGDITTAGTITGEDLVINDAISARTLDSTSISAGTGTFYAGYGEVSIGGFSADALLGGGKIVLGIGPASSRPTGTLTHLGGVLFAENGNLMWLGASGTVSTVAGS